MVRKWEGGRGQVDVVGNDTVLPGGSHELLDDWVQCEAVRAEEILKELDLDVTLAFASNPSWISAVDWSRVRNQGGSSGSKRGSEGKFHIFVTN